ncbi:MAG TPA: Ig-like domain-containing protein [Gammaproteobacteria bacterium]|jgi:hypothetical protein
MRKFIVLMAALLMTALLQGCGGGSAGLNDPTSGSSDIPVSGSSDGSSNSDAAPTITFTGFAVVQVDGALSGKVVAFFSEDMDSSTINTQNFTVTGPDHKRIPGSVLYIGVTAVFTPDARFSTETHYVATISTGVHSLNGVPMAHAKVFGFTTPTPSALTGVLVRVASTEPSAYAIDVPVNNGVNVTFRQIMDPATINPSTLAVYDQAGAKVAGQVHYSGLTASFVPAGSLHPGTTYRVIVSTDVKSLAGVGMDEPYKTMFTTGTDGTTESAPQVMYTTPLHGDSGVDLNGSVVAAFNESMDTATVNTSTFTLSDADGQLVDGSVSYIGNTAMFTPDAPLLPQTLYTARISGGLTSTGGLQMGEDYSWVFKTGSFSTGTAPTVVFTSPTAYQSAVWSNAIINVAFSAVMDPMTLNSANFQVTDQDGNPVAGSVSYIGNAVMFTPDASLAPGVQYTVTLTSALKSSAGVGITPYSWSFTTMPMQ